VLDEPSAGLDPIVAAELDELILLLKEALQMTVIVVTHEPDIAQYGTRIIQFRDGRIRRDMPVENRKDAAQALRELPPPETEEDDDELSSHS